MYRYFFVRSHFSGFSFSLVGFCVKFCSLLLTMQSTERIGLPPVLHISRPTFSVISFRIYLLYEFIPSMICISPHARFLCVNLWLTVHSTRFVRHHHIFIMNIMLICVCVKYFESRQNRQNSWTAVCLL